MIEICLHLYSKTVVSNIYKQNKTFIFFNGSFKVIAYWISALFTLGAGNCYEGCVLGVVE